mmetsp:Transcript_18104/g.45962  ORF Transcript_18104/g.45962 Transcript_18104/m.45962 type:complete len:346 (-) Transcript_18104:23-1060(-)
MESSQVNSSLSSPCLRTPADESSSRDDTSSKEAFPARAVSVSQAHLLRESQQLDLTIPVEGWLLKKGAVGLVKGWKRRYFCMNLDLNRLAYTLEPQSTRELGHINLHSIRSVFIPPKAKSQNKRPSFFDPFDSNKPTFEFHVETHFRTFHLSATVEQEMIMWVSALRSWLRSNRRRDTLASLNVTETVSSPQAAASSQSKIATTNSSGSANNSTNTNSDISSPSSSSAHTVMRTPSPSAPRPAASSPPLPPRAQALTRQQICAELQAEKELRAELSARLYTLQKQVEPLLALVAAQQRPIGSSVSDCAQCALLERRIAALEEELAATKTQTDRRRRRRRRRRATH